MVQSGLRGLARQILGEREYIVFQARLTADPALPLPREKLAERLGIPVSRVDQIEASAKRKLAIAARRLDGAPFTPPRH